MNSNETAILPTPEAPDAPPPGQTGYFDAAALRALARRIRIDTIELTWHSGTGSSHVGGELSLGEILAVLYGNVLRVDPTNPTWELRDRMILSKGHASGALYAAMAWRGFFPRERLFDQFNRSHGFLEEHVNMRTPGGEVPTGSLGMGLSNGSGMAWAARYLAKDGAPLYRTIVVLSDGDLQEGQSWEAAMAASQYHLDNLVAVVDFNHMVVSGRIERSVDLEPLADKFRQFGWHAVEVDGHDVEALTAALTAAVDPALAPGRPRVVVAHTLKGKGVSFTEGNNAWHGGHLNEEQYRRALADLA